MSRGYGLPPPRVGLAGPLAEVRTSLSRPADPVDGGRFVSRAAKGAVLTVLLVVAGSMAGLSAGSAPSHLTPRAVADVSRAERIVQSTDLRVAELAAHQLAPRAA